MQRFLPLMVTLVSAPGLLVFLVARSSFFTWATAGVKPLNKRALNRIRFISDDRSFLKGENQHSPRWSDALQKKTALVVDIYRMTGNSDVTRLGKDCRPESV